METKEKVGVEFDDIGFSTFLKHNPYLLTQRDYHLTELMEFKKDNSYSSFVILSDYLKLYGIHVIGNTHIKTPTKNSELVNKYIIVKDIYFSDFMKDEDGKIKTYNTRKEALETCGMYEFEDVLVLKIEANYIENE